VVSEKIREHARRHHRVHRVEYPIRILFWHFVLDKECKPKYVAAKIVWDGMPLQVDFPEIKGPIKASREMVKRSLDVEVQILGIERHPFLVFAAMNLLAFVVDLGIQQLQLVAK
jgi:hypothetical protein